MKKLLMLFMLSSIIGAVFAQAAAAATPDYRHEDVCMYRGYPWDDRW
jgi:hypothetical protein